MDLGEKDKFGLEKRGVDPLNYHSSNMSSDWQFSGTNLLNQSMDLVPTDNSIPVCKGDLMGCSNCSSVSMVDSFCPTLWRHPNPNPNPQNLGLCESNVQTSSSTANPINIGKGVSSSSRTSIDKAFDLGWNPPNSISKGGLFLQTSAGIIPPSLSNFPADSAFIERAARFSCFNGGSFSDMLNPFTVSESLNPYSKAGGAIQGPPEILSPNGLRSQSQKNEPNMAEISKDASMSIELGTTEGSPINTERKMGSFMRPIDESKQRIGASSSVSDEAEFSGGGGGGQEEPSMLVNQGGEPSSSKGLGAKKRKRSGQDTELDQVNTETKQKGDQKATSTVKASKHGKDTSQASDAPKEDYIHVRARRGQATNSHSLAERVRREKISERMKFLQDLVPGCSKVTGKAVMLDEIINYVQSLQRQVEFLSMKLATVNPRLDLNIEGLLTKDILQSRGGPSSTMAFSPDMSMVHPQLQHPSQQGLIQAGIPSMGNPSDSLRRTISSQLMTLNGGYKDPTSQMPNMWDDELHNVVQMNFGTNAPFNSQDLNGPLPPGHMKAEL